MNTCRSHTVLCGHCPPYWVQRSEKCWEWHQRNWNQYDVAPKFVKFVTKNIWTEGLLNGGTYEWRDFWTEELLNGGCFEWWDLWMEGLLNRGTFEGRNFWTEELLNGGSYEWRDFWTEELLNGGCFEWWDLWTRRVFERRDFWREGLLIRTRYKTVAAQVFPHFCVTIVEKSVFFLSKMLAFFLTSHLLGVHWLLRSPTKSIWCQRQR